MLELWRDDAALKTYRGSNECAIPQSDSCRRVVKIVDNDHSYLR